MELLSLFSWPSALLLTTLTVIGILKTITVLHHMYFYWKKKNIPYLPNSLSSFTRNWKPLLGRISFMDYAQYTYDLFPDAKYIGLMDVATPCVLLRDPELIKDVMVKAYEYFLDRRNLMDENVDSIFARNVSFLRGDKWREMRHTLSPSFTANKIKIMFDLISKCSRDFVDYLADHPELCSVIETKEAFRRYTNDVIATAAFGINVNSMKNRDNEFYMKGVEIIKFFNGFLIMLKFILLRASPRFCKLIGLTFFPPSAKKFFRKIVRKIVKTRKEQGIVRADMIHLLMQARDKEGPIAYKMTSDDIVSQVIIFFIAGFETTATLMCFVIHELAINQSIQDRLREEVLLHVAEGNGEISYESLSKMIYMDMVISETLRKYPPVFFMDRLCTKSYVLPPSQPGYNDVILKPNNVILLPVYFLHHDPKYFPNPEKFDPERFSDENKDNILPYTYLPFGHGPRKCIGNRFALMETKLLVAFLLQKFILKPTEKTVEHTVFALQHVGGFWISLEKRET